MASGPGRLAFVVVLVANVLLWSQSRYARPSDRTHGLGLVPSDIQATSLNFKRAFSEHSNSSLVFDSAPPKLPQFTAEKECRPISFPTPEEQCTHVRDVCEKPDTLLSIDCMHFFFCQPVAWRPFAFVGLLVWLVFLFSTLGISASDFFTPNLATIAAMLGLDENLAGVTFLAFGNGSPDVFSTFSAMHANLGSLAIGELLGAASFIVSVVVGSMCIIKPFHVNRRPFLRDVGFFTIAVALLIVILWDGRISQWEAGVLVVMYVCYVLVVVIGTWLDKRQERRRRLEAVIRGEYGPEEGLAPAFYDEEPYRDEPSAPAPAPSNTLAVPVPVRPRAISSPLPPRLGVQTHLPPRPSRTPSPQPSAYPTQMPSFSLIGALEFRQVVASLQPHSSASLFDAATPITPYAGGHYHTRVRSVRTLTPGGERELAESMWGDAALGGGVPLNLRPSPPHYLVAPALSISDDGDAYGGGGGDEGTGLGSGHTFDSGARTQSSTSVPSIVHVPSSPVPTDDTDTDRRRFTPPTKRQRFLRVLARTYHVLCPTLHNFRQKTLTGKVAALLATPAIMALTLTLPVVVTPYDYTHPQIEKQHGAEARLIDFEEEGMERTLIAEEEVQEELHGLGFNKWLTAVQCALGPLFAVAVLFNGTKHEGWLLIATAVTGLTLAILVAVFSEQCDTPSGRMARCSMGFMVAIVWIMAIADEVVNVLQTFGFMFGLSDAIIGLTIFAAGNSLADLVANMSVAVFAPIMGFSACFGGPMLNILLGIGVSGSVIIHQNATPYTLHFSDTLLVSAFGLLALLLGTLLFIPLNGYYLTRRWGVFLIASYAVLMAVNVVVELRSEHR